MPNFIRPNPPSQVGNAWGSLVGQVVNDHRLHGGSGIAITHGSNGTHISLTNDLDPVNFTNQGTYNFSSSYDPGDVVFVDPNIIYTDQDGDIIPFTATSSSVLPPISGGLFVCTRYVPPLGYDDDMLTTYVIPAYTSQSQDITGGFADTFRLYDYNVFYPIYPLIPTASLTTASYAGVIVTANINFWAPLSPMIPLTVCINGSSYPAYVNGILSGSVFSSSFLPYTG